MGRRSRRRDQAPAPAGPSRSERRDAEARARLEPLAEGERPLAVTIAAVVAAVLAIGNLAAYAAGLTVGDERPPVSGIVVYEVLLIITAVGMWRTRYWAVLGFEFILGLMLAYLAIYLVGATKLIGVVVALAIGIPAAVLFWFLVRAMARIQTPEPPRRR